MGLEHYLLTGIWISDVFNCSAISVYLRRAGRKLYSSCMVWFT